MKAPDRNTDRSFHQSMSHLFKHTKLVTPSINNIQNIYSLVSFINAVVNEKVVHYDSPDASGMPGFIVHRLISCRQLGE